VYSPLNTVDTCQLLTVLVVVEYINEELHRSAPVRIGPYVAFIVCLLVNALSNQSKLVMCKFEVFRYFLPRDAYA